MPALRMSGGLGLAVAIVLAAGCAPAFGANLYVTNNTAGVVSQYAVAADGTLAALSPATVPTAAGPFGIELSPDRRSVYVANTTAGLISQYSVTADGTLEPKTPATVPALRASRIALTPDGAHLYATAAQNPSLVSQFDVAADGTLTAKSPPTVSTGASNTTQGIVVDASGARAYVGHASNQVSQFSIGADGSLVALDPLVVQSAPAPGAATQGLALSPDGLSLYGGNRNSATVSRLAVAADGRLTLGPIAAAVGQPNMVAISPDGQSLYTPNGNASATVSQFTIGADGALAPKSPATVAVPTNPRFLRLSSDGQHAYVAAFTGPSLSLFTVGAGGTLIAKSPATVATAAGPTEIVFSDGPAPGLPAATTGAASAVTDGGAQLAGTVDPRSSLTSFVFEYGPTPAFGAITAPVDAGLGEGPVPVAGQLSGLAPNTTYYYRLVATNAQGTRAGAAASFRTTGGTPAAPVALTLPASAIAGTTAELAGQVNPQGQPTAFTFEYGTSTAFGAITPVVALDDAGALEPVSASLSGLEPGTTYYARVVATNATGTTAGAVVSFTTSGGILAPLATTGAASGVSATGATLTGSVDPRGSATAFAFEYGPTNAFGSLSAVDSAGAVSGAQPVALPIGGLTPGTQYRYRIVATNANGTTAGAAGSFTTSGGT